MAAGSYAELVVRDNGMGIAAESLPHLFDPAWQMRRMRADGGRTGGVWLGLAVVHRIVELHGGRIVASSGGASMGAVFTVRLPLAEVVVATRSRYRASGKFPHRRTPRVEFARGDRPCRTPNSGGWPSSCSHCIAAHC